MLLGVLAVALIAIVVDASVAALDSISPECRCVPAADGTLPPCWRTADWDGLNRSVGGRLIGRDGLLLPSEATDNQTLLTDFDYLTSQPGFTFWRGYIGSWDQREARSEYAVLAEGTADVQAAVRFAARHHLRLVVKGTGHSFQGRSSAPGSLLLWTHRMRATKWHDSLNVCGKEYEHAVEVGAGSQFEQTHEEASRRGRLEMGGLCPTVGFNGFASGGGFGIFSRSYGTGATSIIQAQVVLANGSLVLATPCNEFADLLRAIRGGGGGTFGVTVSLMYRTFEQPTSTGAIEAVVQVKDLEDMSLVTEHFLNNLRDNVMRKGLLQHLGGNLVLQPLLKRVILRMAYVGISQSDCSAMFSNVSERMKIDCVPASNWRDVAVLNKTEVSPQADSRWLSIVTRHFTESAFDTEQSTANFSSGIKRILEQNPQRLEEEDSQLNIMFQWGLSQASSVALENFTDTSMNPAVSESIGVVTWERMIQGSHFVAGKEVSENVTAQLKEDEARTHAWYDHLLGQSAGSNLNIAGCNVPKFQNSFWGSNYPALLATKDKYDPSGLFFCSQCVGSERWTADGTCPVMLV